MQGASRWPLSVRIVNGGPAGPAYSGSSSPCRCARSGFSKHGKPISSLESKNFQVYDNGRAQRLTLDIESSPISIVVAIQANQDVRTYVPFINRGGSLLQNSLVGEKGEPVVLTYGDDVTY